MNKLDAFIESIFQNLEVATFRKVTLMNKREKDSALKSVQIKWLEIKGEDSLSFVYRNETNDITKNYTFKKGLDEIKQLLNNSFFQAILFTAEKDIHFSFKPNGKSKLTETAATLFAPIAKTHDKEKKKWIDLKNNIYLKELNILSAENKIKKDKNKKFKQINRFIEICSTLIAQLPISKELSVVDMGSGKGYLSFALFDYLSNLNTFKQIDFKGIELRKSLVDECNRISDLCGFKNLEFIDQSIEKFNQTDIDILIALHACDTATDDAISKGIKSDAKLIVCSPCCHKQIRKAFNVKNQLSAITKHGILKERMAEIVTDTIRALILEAFGYKTQVIEYISSEHTSKNLLITATKISDPKEINHSKLEEIKSVKETFGIDKHHLETLMDLG